MDKIATQLIHNCVPGIFEISYNITIGGIKAARPCVILICRAPSCVEANMDYVDRLLHCGLALQEAEFVCCYMTIYLSEEDLEKYIQQCEKRHNELHMV